MTLVLENQPVPLKRDEDHVVRVGGTRVPLETVVGAFLEGATAEEMAQQYPSLALSDIYLVISYYLNHRDQVHRYLQRRKRKSQVVKEQNEDRFDPEGIRDRLLARKEV